MFGLVAEEQVFGLEIAMYDALVVEIDDGVGDGANDVGGILLVVVATLADAVEQLAAHAEVGDEVEVVHGLKVVDERDDAAVTLGDALEGGDLVAHHVLAASHELLGDDLAGVVLAGLDVHGLLDDGIGALAERAAGLVGAWHGLRL